MTPREKILKYANNQYLKERDKWESGIKNSYFEWEDEVRILTNLLSNYDLLVKENTFLKRKLNIYKEKYEKVSDE